MTEGFEFLDMDRPDDFSRLLDKISSTFEQDRGPSLEIIQLIRKQKVKSVVIEYNIKVT